MNPVPFPQAPADPMEALRAFRSRFHGCLRGWADTAFQLGDALVEAPGRVDSLPALSLEGCFERSNGSLYKALAGCRADTAAARDLLAGTLPDPPGPWGRHVFAVDATTWPKPDAETSPGRGWCYTTAKGSSGQPVVAGWCYQVAAALDWQTDSWAAPADAVRLEPGRDTVEATRDQVRAVAASLPTSAGPPAFVFDGGYNAAALAWELADDDLTLIVRIRDDRVFHEDPAPREPGQNGRPRRHGPRRSCANPADWPAPDLELAEQDNHYGLVTVQAWDGLHPQLARRGHWESFPQAPIVKATIVKLEVEKMPGPRSKPKQALWLWASGAQAPLSLIWRAYVHRFDIEHLFRLMKQTLGWTVPKTATPQQADTWTWLVLAAHTQLRLARPLVTDLRLPWERPPNGRLSPNRVRRGFRQLAPILGTPTSPPKPSKAGPGRPKGSRSGPRARYPVTKTTPTKV